MGHGKNDHTEKFSRNPTIINEALIFEIDSFAHRARQYSIIKTVHTNIPGFRHGIIIFAIFSKLLSRIKFPIICIQHLRYHCSPAFLPTLVMIPVHGKQRYRSTGSILALFPALTGIPLQSPPAPFPSLPYSTAAI